MTEDIRANFFKRLSACASGHMGAQYENLTHDITLFIELGLMNYGTTNVYI